MSLELFIPALIVLLVALVCLLIGRQASRIKHDRVAAVVKKMGGTFRAKDTGVRKQVTAIDLHGSLADNAGLAKFSNLNGLEYLDLSGTKITDLGLKHLQGLKKLQSLKLGSTKITDAGLEHLKGLINLQSLDLHATKVSDGGVEQLQEVLKNTKIKR
jgi:hypothetical protein